MSYNGHANYETWAVSLYLDGNYTGEGTYLTVNALADACESAYELADALRSFVEESIGDLGASLVADLIGAALSEVAWRDLADGLISERDERNGH